METLPVFFYKIARGIDDRPVQPHRETKSLAAEDTFPYDLATLDEMAPELDKIAQTVSNRLQHYELKGRTITLKIKYSDFKQVTRSRSFPNPIDDLPTISATARELLAGADLENKKVRLLGISLSNFDAAGIRSGGSSNGQLELF